MTPTLEQLAAQFGRLTGTVPGASTVVGPAPAPPAAASSEGRAAVPASPVQPTDHAAKGWNLDVTVAPPQVVQAAEILDQYGFALDAVTGVDWLAQAQMEVVYDYFHPTVPLRVAVRTRVPRAEPAIPTIAPVFPGANWHEREAHDFFGLEFTGHPNLTPFLLPEDATYHPLRKDFQS
jgi:NADH-quinone oxidoreductase subunit C